MLLLGLIFELCVHVHLQEPFQGIDAEEGSMFETEFSPTKGDNNTDMSWTSTPVSLCLLAQLQ